MHNICVLIKNYFLIFLNNFKSKKNKAKFISGGLICLFVVVLLILMQTFTSLLTTTEIIKLMDEVPGIEQMAMFSNIVMGLLLIGIFTILKSIYPAKSQDRDILSSLPLTKLEIISSKILYSVLFDIVSLSVVILPSFVVYFIVVPNSTFMIVVWGIIFVIIGSLLLNGISYLISLLFLKITSRFKNAGLIQSFLSILILGGFLVVQYSLPSYLSNFSGNPSEFISNIFGINILIDWIINNNIVNMLIILLVSIIIFTLSILLRVYFYDKNFKEYRSKNNNLIYTSSSILKCLFIKEIKYYIHTPVYLLNTIFGSFLLIGLASAYRIIGKEQVLAFVNTLPILKNLDTNVLIIILSMIVISTISTTSVSISLEGRKLWFLQANPLKLKDIFLSKILLNVFIVFVTSFLSAILFTDFNNLLIFIPLFLIPFLSGVVVSIVGLIINLYFPKLDWLTEEEVVKRGMSVLIAMSINFLISLIFPVIYFVFGKDSWNMLIFSIIGIVIEILLIILSSLLLKTKGVEKFKNINA